MSDPSVWLTTELEGILDELDADRERVYRRRLPETATLPAFTFSRVGAANEYTHGGDSDLPAIRYQVDCIADNPDTADDLALIAYQRFSGKRAPGGLASAFIDSDLDDDDVESKTYRRVLDVIITWAGGREGS